MTFSVGTIQLPLLMPPRASQLAALESKGVAYTKRWVVGMLLDLAGYKSDANLADAVAVEPAAGDGAFLGPMIERLADSCQRLDRAALRLPEFADCLRARRCER